MIVALLAAAPVFLDPGHGLPDNSGATSVFCEKESDLNLRVTSALAARLRKLGTTIELARTASVGPSYPERIAHAARVEARALLSIHADTRGTAVMERGCPRRDAEPGFSILFSDEGTHARRRSLARAIAKAMTKQGFVAYDGIDYGTLYEKDQVPGVFIDRRGLFMLRRPAMPSIVIETHHAWHLAEVKSWRTAETLDRFAAAVHEALESWR
jgi:N-acetylmuramoyl-L-alanine amidase